jgi:adenylate cyclase
MRPPPVYLLLAAAFLGLLGLIEGLRIQGYLQFLELAAYDLLVATAAADIDPDNSPITLIEVTEEDIQHLGNWPVTDRQLTEILHRLMAAQPRVIGVDIYRDLPVPPGRPALDALLSSAPGIIAIEKFPEAGDSGISPPPVLEGTQQVGFSDLVADRGGVVRRGLLFLADGERVGYAFALRLALAYLAGEGLYPQPGRPDPSHMRLGDVTLVPLESNDGAYVGADTAGYQILLDFAGGPSPFSRYRLRQLLDGDIPEEELRDRIIILGVAAASVKDDFLTPFAILGGDQGRAPGSTLHAYTASQLLGYALHDRQPVAFWPEAGEASWTALWIVLGLVGGWLSGHLARLTAIVSVGAALLGLCALLAFRSGWWIPVVAPLLGWVGATGLGLAVNLGRRRREQKVLMGLFACHVSPEVAKIIWDRRDEILHGGRIRPQVLTATVLFSDLKGFTRMSETMDPEPFLEWLNSYMAALTDTVMRFGGFLDDYAGDGLKANFGVPLARTSREQITEDARNAVRCARALAAEIDRMNDLWQARGRARVAMRVGIHTGPVVIGSVGSKARMKFTTVGSQVNLAARLESIREIEDPDPDDTSSSCRVLISSETAQLVREHFRLESKGRFSLKGVAEEREIFQVLDLLAQDDGVCSGPRPLPRTLSVSGHGAR